ncbi:unnamed protein product, partial [Closterium sp. NIES-65]
VSPEFSAYRMNARRIAIIGMVPVAMEDKTRLTDCTWHGSDGLRINGDLTTSLVGKHHNYIYDVAVLLCTLDSATKAGGHLEARIEQEILFPYREEESEPLGPPSALPLNVAACVAPIHGSIDARRLLEWLHFHRVLLLPLEASSPLPLNVAACVSPIHDSIDARRLLEWLHFHRVLLPVDRFLPALRCGGERGQREGVWLSTSPSLPEPTLPFASLPLSLPVLQPLEAPSPLPLNVAACVSPIHDTIDARRLLEWLHFHRVLLPVDRFLLYDAGGIAGNGEAGPGHKEVQRVLAPRVKRGMVDVTWGFREVLQWDVWNYGEVCTWGGGEEHLAIQDCIYRTRNAARWLLVSDIDEYLQIPPPLSLPALLQEHESLPWLTFGATAFNGSFCSPLQLPPQAAGGGEGEGEGGGGGEGNGGGEEGEEERKRAAAMAANEAKAAFAVERMRFRWPHPVCSATDVYSASQCLDEEGSRRYILDPRRAITATANSVASSRPGINLPVETARLARFPGISQSGFATCTLGEPSDSWWEKEEGVAALAEAARRCPALKPWTKGASAECENHPLGGLSHVVVMPAEQTPQSPAVVRNGLSVLGVIPPPSETYSVPISPLPPPASPVRSVGIVYPFEPPSTPADWEPHPSIVIVPGGGEGSSRPSAASPSTIDVTLVSHLVDQTRMRIKNRYLNFEPDHHFGSGEKMTLNDFIQRHQKMEKREVKAEGVDSDGNLVEFSYTLHENPIEGQETDGDVTACFELSLKFVRAVDKELEWRMKDLEELEGCKLFCVVFPSASALFSRGIDPHTHLAMPFMGTESCDDFYSGQAAALAGGTTFHIDYVLGATPASGGDLLRILEEYEGKAKGNAVMDYGFHMGVTRWSEEVARDMEEVVKRGINSFKFFMAYKGALQVDDQQLLDGFTRCKHLGAIPQVHAENGDAVVWGQQHIFDLGITGPEGHPLSRPPEVEEEATGRAIRLANVVGVPLYVVHVMSAGAAREVAEARRRGQRVVGEPVVSGIALNDSHLWSPDFKHAAQFVMSPPIRSAEHVAAVKAALATGTLQLVATDHCPFNSTQKAKGRHDFRLIPNGVNGIEERMHITWDVMVNSGLMSPSDYVRITSTECARIFNLYPQKGVVAEGSDADVIVLNPRGSTTISATSHHSRIDTNVYEGWRMQGNIEVTVSQGRVVWRHGRLNVTRGAGRFVPMRPFGPLFHGMQARDAARRHSYHAPVRRDEDVGAAADV